ncbi:MAG: 50S ribosomal protein L9 [Bacilli bacterium]|nr:50S ribosomal protein L9 [Bacilli bacterium]
MRVILLKDVKGIGKKNDIVNVKDGYASNYLIPNGLAVMESKGSIEVLNKQKADKAKKDADDKANAEVIAKQLENIVLEFKANVGEDGRMFGTISNKQVEEELKKTHNIVIDKRKIITKVPVDRLGYTILDIELYKGVVGKIKVHVSGKEK